MSAHRMTGTPTYASWASMMQRCGNPKSPKYALYGARGITVCEKWRTFSGFFSDMGLRPFGRSLDRIDNNGNYEPSNCRWSDPKTQSRNKSNHHLVALGGEMVPLAVYAERMGFSFPALRQHIYRGNTVESYRPRKKITCL